MLPMFFALIVMVLPIAHISAQGGRSNAISLIQISFQQQFPYLFLIAGQ